jgi:ATP-binding cassette, subfamily B (MDR/TAP), member 1
MSGAGNGEEHGGEPEAAAAPFLGMFRYADRTDAALMAVGTAAAVANGMAEPLMTVVFSAVIESFGAGDNSTILHRASKVRNCVYVGFLPGRACVKPYISYASFVT